jgi:hypothetical protein
MVMFDVLVLGLWTVAGWGLHRAVRVLRRRAAPPRRLLASGGVLSRAVLVAALLVLPIWAGFGWSGLRVWAPDLWLVLLVLIALLTATTAVRLAGLTRPRPAGRGGRTDGTHARLRVHGTTIMRTGR